jgi:hypothetical protein
MMLEVAPGSVAVPSSNNTGTVLCVSDAVENLTLDPAPPSGQERRDLIICQSRGTDLDGGTDNDFVFAFVKGTVYVPPFDPVRDMPVTPPGAVALASVGIDGGSATITPAYIIDQRPGALAVPEGGFRQFYVRNASVGTEATVDYMAPPSSPFHTQGNAGADVNNQMTFTRDCVVSIAGTFGGATTDRLWLTMDSRAAGFKQYWRATQNWGGAFAAVAALTQQMRAGDVLQIAGRGMGNLSWAAAFSYTPAIFTGQ